MDIKEQSWRFDIRPSLLKQFHQNKNKHHDSFISFSFRFQVNYLSSQTDAKFLTD